MRLLLWFLGFSCVILMIWMVWGGHWEQWADVQSMGQHLQGFGVSAAWAGFGLLVMDLVLPVPGTVVMSALGFLHGVVWGAVISFAGSTAAGMVGYGVGRLCRESLTRRFLGEKDFARGRRLFSAGGGWMVAISRAVPILPEAIAVTAGMVRMPWRKFLLALMCGNAPMAVVFSWIGAAGNDRPWLAMLLSLALPAVLWSAAWWYDRRSRAEEVL